jgi:hypothetical protein
MASLWIIITTLTCYICISPSLSLVFWLYKSFTFLCRLTITFSLFMTSEFMAFLRKSLKTLNCTWIFSLFFSTFYVSFIYVLLFDIFQSNFVRLWVGQNSLYFQVVPAWVSNRTSSFPCKFLHRVTWGIAIVTYEIFLCTWILFYFTLPFQATSEHLLTWV